MTELLTLLTSGQTATTTGQGGNDIVSILTMLIPLALMVVIFYFLIIRPEKKRGKKMQEMLNNLEVADEVVTTGGIVGRVLRVTDDTVLIETGSDRTKIRVLRAVLLRTELFTMIRNQSKRFLGIIKNTLTASAVRVFFAKKSELLIQRATNQKH